MPSVTSGREDLRVGLRPFQFHGLEFEVNSTQGKAECPFCGKDKFYVNVDTGLWDCKVCAKSGNPTSFMRELASFADRETPGTAYKTLAESLGLIHTDSLLEVGVAIHPIRGGGKEWCVAGHGADGKVTQLYRYISPKKGEKPALLATPETDHGLHVIHSNHGAETIYICEGWKDGIVIREALRSAKTDDDGSLNLTGTIESSLLADAEVIAVPGLAVWKEAWSIRTARKNVVILFDSDHVNSNSKESAGWAGAKRLTQKLAKAEEPPSAIAVLRWGEDGFDPDKKSGWDVRDHLTQGKTPRERVERLQSLLGMVGPIPEDWLAGRTREAKKRGETTISVLKCSEWRTVQNAFRRAMRWPESGTGLDHALVCMLAVVASTKALGSQLWMKVIGPASCGKSTLCEALSVSKKYVLAKSTIRGFHSGFKSDGGGEEDNSLLAIVNNKTLVTKDGDTLMASPNVQQVLSEARDVYDRVSRSHYRNRMGKDYEGLNMTWLLCGTSALRSLDSSELGERFLDCVIMEEIDEDAEDMILGRVFEKSVRNVQMESTGAAEDQHDPDMLNAIRLTGGYVEHLRENAQLLLGQIAPPSAEVKRRMKALSKFVSFLRARPSSRQKETVEREFSARLLEQLVRLAMCTAVVLNKREIDEEVYQRVWKVAVDTARGVTLKIVRQLADAGRSEGMTVHGLSIVTRSIAAETKKLLVFLQGIGAVTLFSKEVVGTKGRTSEWRYALTESFTDVYRTVDPYGDA